MQIPSADDVLADLTPLRPLLYASVRGGVAEARRYFFGAGAEIDPYLFCHIVRFRAKQVLEGEGYSVQEFELADLANSGLAMTFAGYPIRIRKGDQGQLPAPQSQSLLDFYEQQQLRLTFPGEMPGKPNLVVLWDVERPSYEMTKTMVLACPAGVTRSDVPCHWKVALPISDEQIQPGKRNTVDEPVEDLDLKPLDGDEEERKDDHAG
jgi:hypothetical protein